MTDLLGEFIPRCKHCWIDVVPMPEAHKIWGRGEAANWKHKVVRDEDGNASCNRPLKDEDIESVAQSDF